MSAHVAGGDQCNLSLEIIPYLLSIIYYIISTIYCVLEGDLKQGISAGKRKQGNRVKLDGVT